MYGNKRSLVAGAVVGGLLALLFTPKTGREFRKEIGCRCVSLKDNTCLYASELKEKGLYLVKEVDHSGWVQKIRKVNLCREENCDGVNCERVGCNRVSVKDECESEDCDVIIPSHRK